MCAVLAFLLSSLSISSISFFFFFNDTATTEIYTLSLHDALPISARVVSITGDVSRAAGSGSTACGGSSATASRVGDGRSEEHTSELQSRQYLVCRLLLEKKKKETTHRGRYVVRRTAELSRVHASS